MAPAKSTAGCISCTRSARNALASTLFGVIPLVFGLLAAIAYLVYADKTGAKHLNDLAKIPMANGSTTVGGLIVALTVLCLACTTLVTLVRPPPHLKALFNASGVLCAAMSNVFIAGGEVQVRIVVVALAFCVFAIAVVLSLLRAACGRASDAYDEFDMPNFKVVKLRDTFRRAPRLPTPTSTHPRHRRLQNDFGDDEDDTMDSFDPRARQPPLRQNLMAGRQSPPAKFGVGDDNGEVTNLQAGGPARHTQHLQKPEPSHTYAIAAAPSSSSTTDQ